MDSDLYNHSTWIHSRNHDIICENNLPPTNYMDAGLDYVRLSSEFNNVEQEIPVTGNTNLKIYPSEIRATHILPLGYVAVSAPLSD